MGRLEIRLFGTLTVEHDGRNIERFPSRRVKDLFSYLLLNRSTVHQREHLAGIFWTDLEERKARHCLNTSLWRLNQVLPAASSDRPPYLRVDAHTVGFNGASDFHLDVQEFENRCTWAEHLGDDAGEQQAAFYQQAVQHYRADLLVDCYEDWCLVERERLQALYLRVLGWLVTYHRKRGEYEPAIDYGLRILRCDPLREEVQRDVISLYLDAHRPSAAIQQYRSCEDVLQRELGIAPMPETQALLTRAISNQSGQSQTGHQHPMVETPEAPTSPVSLTSALLSLRLAVANFDTAYAELKEVAALVERLSTQHA